MYAKALIYGDKGNNKNEKYYVKRNLAREMSFSFLQLTEMLTRTARAAARAVMRRNRLCAVKAKGTQRNAWKRLGLSANQRPGEKQNIKILSKASTLIKLIA